MIKLNGIEKYYQNKIVKTYVLRNIKLEIEEGEFVSIMGPSGAGKSTLLNILGMLDTPSNGEYLFMDEPVHNMNEKNYKFVMSNAYVDIICDEFKNDKYSFNTILCKRTINSKNSIRPRRFQCQGS